MKNNLVLAMLIFCSASIDSLFAAGVPDLADVRKAFNVTNLRNDFLTNGVSADFRRLFPKEVNNLQAVLDRTKKGLTAHEQAQAECQIDQYSVCLINKLIAAKYEEIVNAAGENGADRIKAGDVTRDLKHFVELQERIVSETAKHLDLPPLKIDDSPVDNNNNKGWSCTITELFLGGDRKYLTYAAVTSAVALTIYYWDNINAWLAGEPTDSTQPA